MEALSNFIEWIY